MAACLITIAGTSGKVLIEYTDSSSVKHSIISDIGPLYINDTGSEYTYTTLSGDATASSLCVTISEVAKKCYILDWEVLKLVNPKYIGQTITQLLVGTTTFTFATPVLFPDSVFTIVTAINQLNSLLVKATAYRQVNTTNKSEYFIILTIKGNDIPYLKINSATDNHNLFLKGTLTTNCLPTGYNSILNCDSLT